ERVTTPGGAGQDCRACPPACPPTARARRLLAARAACAARTRPNGRSRAGIATGAARTCRGPRPLCEGYARARPTPVGRGILMSQLSDLIDPSAISLDITVADWREAIRASGDLLVASGVTGAAYVDAM